MMKYYAFAAGFIAVALALWAQTLPPPETIPERIQRQCKAVPNSWDCTVQALLYYRDNRIRDIAR